MTFKYEYVYVVVRCCLCFVRCHLELKTVSFLFFVVYFVVVVFLLSFVFMLCISMDTYILLHSYLPPYRYCAVFIRHSHVVSLLSIATSWFTPESKKRLNLPAWFFLCIWIRWYKPFLFLENSNLFTYFE